MPTESALILSAIVVAFAVFGAVVAFVDIYSRRRPDHRPAE
jgi:multisubunit Na+/H+ antiporter MnhC subunit